MCECSADSGHRIHVAKGLKETEPTVTKPLLIGVQGTNLLWDHMILARERSVGSEAERGEIDSKMGRRVCVV